MTDLNINASAGVDESTPFCPRTYFHGLREAGVRPYARSHAGRDSSGQWCDDPAANRNARPWYAWAREQDPEQAQIDAYVVGLLDKHRRTDDDLVILKLGFNDDEIEPEVLRAPVQAARVQANLAMV